MTELLISIIIAGTATTYVIEAIDLIIYQFIDKSFLAKIFSLPLCLGALWIFQRDWTLEMVVSAPAATFVSLVLFKYLNKTTVEYRTLPRSLPRL